MRQSLYHSRRSQTNTGRRPITKSRFHNMFKPLPAEITRGGDDEDSTPEVAAASAATATTTATTPAEGTPSTSAAAPAATVVVAATADGDIGVTPPPNSTQDPPEKRRKSDGDGLHSSGNSGGNEYGVPHQGILLQQQQQQQQQQTMQYMGGMTAMARTSDVRGAGMTSATTLYAEPSMGTTLVGTVSAAGAATTGGVTTGSMMTAHGLAGGATRSMGVAPMTTEDAALYQGYVPTTTPAAAVAMGQPQVQQPQMQQQPQQQQQQRGGMMGMGGAVPMPAYMGMDGLGAPVMKAGGGNAKFALIMEGAARAGLTVTVGGNRYIKLDVIGRGGSSKVYRVLGPHMDIYALKRVNLQTTEESKSTIQGYKNEIELLRKLRQNAMVIQLIDAEIREEHRMIDIVLEFGETDLAKMLKQYPNGHIDLNLVRVFWQQMLCAVKAIHEERIVHGDLKPANFVLVRGMLKLIDFGIAKQISQNTTHIVREDRLGTLSYMAPEAIGDLSQLANPAVPVKVSRAADTWSLGCILYQMTYGRPPFNKVTSMYQKVRCICDPACEIDYPARPGTPPALIDTLRHCLRRSPTERLTLDALLAHPFLTGEPLGVSHCPHCPHCRALAAAATAAAARVPPTFAGTAADAASTTRNHR